MDSIAMTFAYASLGAPECDRYLEDGSNPEAIQLLDIWSLGCVFSTAATWIALGSRGLREYEQRRVSFMRHLKKDPVAMFHDGEKVISAVSDWHTLLRGYLRAEDNITGSVLDMIDEHLFQPGNRRFTAKQLHRHLEQILQHARKKDQNYNLGPVVPFKPGDSSTEFLLTSAAHEGQNLVHSIDRHSSLSSPRMTQDYVILLSVFHISLNALLILSDYPRRCFVLQAGVPATDPPDSTTSRTAALQCQSCNLDQPHRQRSRN
jgi:serine/threonine protein kinase